MFSRTLRSTISERRAAALIGASILGSCAAIELARVWFAGRNLLVADQLLGVAAALLLSITATALVTNDDREIAPLIVLSMFLMLAHGGTLAIELSPFGVIYLTAAVIVLALLQVASGRYSLGLGSVRRSAWKTARAAAPVVSPSPHATHA